MPGDGPTSGGGQGGQQGTQMGDLDMSPAMSSPGGTTATSGLGPAQPQAGTPNFYHQLMASLNQGFMQGQQSNQMAQQQQRLNSLQSNPMGQNLAKMFKKLLGPQAGAQFTPGPVQGPTQAQAAMGDDGSL